MKNNRNLATIFIVLALVVVVGAVVAFGQESDDGDSGSEDTAITEYAKPEILVDTAWVQDNLNNTDVVILEAGSNEEAFNEGHIPGAVFLHVSENLSNPDDATRGQIATAEQVAENLGALGISADDTIVLYDSINNLWATRAYWALKYYSHTDVRLYNGGSKLWVADGNELATETTEVAATTYEIGDADPAIRTDYDYVIAHLDDADVQVCDTRSVDEYLGTDVRADRGGHIPGAINLEWTAAVNPSDGTFLAAAELDELFSKAGFDRDKAVLTYCQTGVRGAHTWFVLSELLGYDDVRNYDGSWEEYGNNAESEIET